jgi:DNA gyrase subunit A
MLLNRLTGLEKQKIVDELDEVNKRIAWLNMVLADVSEVNKIIVGELKAIKELYSDPRRTRIEGSANEIDDEDLITDEDVIVTYTNTGYVKRISVSEYRNQKRGGKGLKGMETRDEDYVVSIFSATTKTTLLVFTDKGKIYWLKVHRLPQGTRTSKGKAIHNVVNLSKGETVKVIRPVEEFVDDKFVVMITRKGIIKKSSLSLFSNPRPSGIIALTTDLDDELISAKISSGKDDVFIATQHGMSIRFDESDVRQMGRSARGVKGITLGKDDFVVGMDIISKEDKSASILMITEKGYGKRTPVEEYRVQSRGGVGVITQKTTEKVGPVVETRMVQDYFDVIVATDRGQVMRTRCSEISVLGRNTQGVRVMNLNPEETVVGIAIIDDREGSEDSEDSKDVAKSES